MQGVIFTNAIKTMGKVNQEAARSSVAYKALIRIGTIYDLEGSLKNLSPDERLKERQTSIMPLVEKYLAWIKEVIASGKCSLKQRQEKDCNTV